MNVVTDLILRTVSTLIATLTTVVIITDRQRRICNAKVELAAQYIESIEHERTDDDPNKEVIKDLKIAEEMIRDIAWSRIARASKIEEVVHISRKLGHVRKKHEKMEALPDVNEHIEAVWKEIERGKFLDLAQRVRKLKVGFVDFVFVGSQKHHS